MLIIKCSQECYGRTDGSVTISFRNVVGEGIIKRSKEINALMLQILHIAFNVEFRSYLKSACVKFGQMYDCGGSRNIKLNVC